MAGVAGLGAMLAVLCAVLWPLWRSDPDLAHGMFIPALSAILVAESRRRGEPRLLFRPGWVIGGSALLALASVTLLGLAGVLAAVLDWTHSLVGFLLASSAASILGAGLLAFSDARVRLLPLNWQSFLAAAVWLLAAPLPPGTYAQLSQALQGAVTEWVVNGLCMLGVAAHRSGNVIELARASVGVSEACSGIRGLLSCVAAGLFLSGVLTSKPFFRLVLVALAPVIALVMNFIRSLALSLMASRGIDVAGRWHDGAGIVISLATTAVLALLAFGLEGRTRARPAATGPAAPAPSATGGLCILSGGLLLGAFLGIFLASSTHPFSHPSGASPDLASLLPEAPNGYTAFSDPALASAGGVLGTERLESRAYVPDGAGNRAGQISLYVAYWGPGQAPVSLVDSHTPDACWPGGGWERSRFPEVARGLNAGGRPLPEAQSRLFERDGRRQYVWFWHLYGGRPLAYEDPYSFRRLLGLAVRYGFQHNKDQLFVRVSSDRPWADIASGEVVGPFFANLRPLGL